MSIFTTKLDYNSIGEPGEPGSLSYRIDARSYSRMKKTSGICNLFGPE